MVATTNYHDISLVANGCGTKITLFYAKGISRFIFLRKVYMNNQRIETSCQSILIFNAQLTSTLLNNEVVHMMLFNRVHHHLHVKKHKKSVSFLPGLKS